MTNRRGRRGIGLTLILPFLALGTLAPDAAAQPGSNAQEAYLRDLWDDPANWGGQGGPAKALRATVQKQRWEVLVLFEGTASWRHQGFLEQISEAPLVAGDRLGQSFHASFEEYSPAILVARVQDSRGAVVYVVAAALAEDSSWSELKGEPLIPLIPLFLAPSLPEAASFAKAYGAQVARDAETGDPDSALPGGEPLPSLPVCEDICWNQYTSSVNQCNLTYAACSATVNAAFVFCAEACLGVPICEAACFAASLLALGNCVLSLNSCTGTAGQIRDLCLADCFDGGPGCGSVVTQTVTTSLSLGEANAGGLDLAPRTVTFPLARSETRGGESFLMEEWAVVQRGEVTTSSNPAFGQALAEQGAVPLVGSHLVVQEPVHAHNSREIPRPEARILSTGLPPTMRGTGQVVAARVEISPAEDVDRVEILFTSEPMDETQLSDLVSHRVGIAFASEKRHRTVVFVVFRLTDRLEVLGTYSVLPQCCCGEFFCA